MMELDFAARAPGDRGRQLRRARVRADVPALRQPRDGASSRGRGSSRRETRTVSAPRCSGSSSSRGSRDPRRHGGERRVEHGGTGHHGEHFSGPSSGGRATCSSRWGARPNTHDLGLEARGGWPCAIAAMATSRWTTTLETSAPHVYGRSATCERARRLHAHVAYNDYEIVAISSRTCSMEASRKVTRSDPDLRAVRGSPARARGHERAAEARESGATRCSWARGPMTRVGRARERGETARLHRGAGGRGHAGAARRGDLGHGRG
jgi:hypothetical protein